MGFCPSGLLSQWAFVRSPSGEHILAPVLKYILASAVSSYDGQVFLGKFIHVALLFSIVDESVWINLFMNSRI